MARSKVAWLALVLSIWMLLPARSVADPGLGSCFWKEQGCCPPHSYSCWHVLTPQLYRAYSCLCGPKVSVYAVDRFPEIPPRYEVIPFPCKAADTSGLYMYLYGNKDRQLGATQPDQP